MSLRTPVIPLMQTVQSQDRSLDAERHARPVENYWR